MIEDKNYRYYAAIIDRETAHLSGGFDRQDCFQDLLARGPEILPNLIEDVREAGDWWRFQMISVLADQALGQAVIFEPEISGRFALVRQRYLDWWDRDGELAFQEMVSQPETTA